MTNTSKKIVFFGTEDFSVTSLKAMVESGYKPDLIVTKPDSKSGRGHKLTPPVVKIIGKSLGIKVLQPSKISEIKEELSDLGSPVGILVSYGKIIPKEIIDLFNPGIINVHPSLLPKYRGPSPIESAILNGDEKTGVSIMKLSASMDSGPIYMQKEVNLDQTETGPSLSDKLARLGAAILVESIPKILDGALVPVEQDDKKASYCKLLTKNDSVIDPSDITAVQAERRVRAFAEYPKTKYTYGEITVTITKASLSSEPKTKIDILFKDDNYLVVDEIVAPSGRKMSAKDFINGYLV